MHLKFSSYFHNLYSGFEDEFWIYNSFIRNLWPIIKFVFFNKKVNANFAFHYFHHLADEPLMVIRHCNPLGFFKVSDIVVL